MLSIALKERFRNFVHRTAHIHQTARDFHRDIELARQRKAVASSADFVDLHMSHVKSHADKFSLLATALPKVSVQGSYCEFGVYQGDTIRFIASKVTQEIHGFDSFEGLPEDWRPGFDKGAFRVDSLPQVPSHVKLHKGWFENTIPGFKAAHPGAIAFLHLDADLYSSTKTVFDSLGDQIVAGTVIQFDEFFNFPGWEQGEHKAFEEFCSARNVKTDYLGYTRGDEQVAVRIAAIDRL